MLLKKEYTLRVGPPPEFDRRFVYTSRLKAEKQTNTKFLTKSMNSYSFATLMQDNSHFSYVKNQKK